MRKAILRALFFLALGLLAAPRAHAAVIISLYGDIDGFGVGAGATVNPIVSNAGPGEAAFTDVRLIGDCCTAFGTSFNPTGGFSYVIPAGDVLVSATLTMRAGALDTHGTPVDGVGTNQIFLDGMAIPVSFFSQFTLNNGGEPTFSFVETQSIGLPAAFLALLSDGGASLLGTNISERSGSGSFQIDFLQLTIETRSVPEPATLALFGVSLFGLGARGLRRRRQ